MKEKYKTLKKKYAILLDVKTKYLLNLIAK